MKSREKNIPWSKIKSVWQIRIIWRTFKNTDFGAHAQRFGFSQSEMGPGNLHLSNFSKHLACKVNIYHNFENRGFKNMIRTALLYKI